MEGIAFPVLDARIPEIHPMAVKVRDVVNPASVREITRRAGGEKIMTAIAREMRRGFPHVRGERFSEVTLERAWDDGKVIFAQPGEDHAVMGILENDVSLLPDGEEVEVSGVERPEVEVMGITEGEEAIPHADAEGAGAEILAGGFRVKDILPRFLVE